MAHAPHKGLRHAPGSQGSSEALKPSCVLAKPIDIFPKAPAGEGGKKEMLHISLLVSPYGENKGATSQGREGGRCIPRSCWPGGR